MNMGYNYRLTDLQCALGLSQLHRLGLILAQRQMLARSYAALLASVPEVQLLSERPGCQHAWHLFVVQVPRRNLVFQRMREAGFGVNVHYIPAYLHPYYRQLGFAAGECPVAEVAYSRLLTLPLFPAMSYSDVQRVVSALKDALAATQGYSDDSITAFQVPQ